MAKKKLTLTELLDNQHDVDQNILRVRKVLEAYQAELAKVNSPENKRRLTPAALAEDTEKLRRKTEMSLATVNATIAQHVRESFEQRDAWTYETVLRTSRFAPEAHPHPGTVEAQQRALNYEMLEAFKRGNAENRAARYTPEDLATEAARAAENGDVATLAVYAQEARNRKLAGLEKLAFDSSFKKLRLEEIDQAQAVFSELEGLAKEADSLFVLWKEPNNQVAQVEESLGRLNRKKKAEEFIKKAIEAESQQHHAGETEQSSAA